MKANHSRAERERLESLVGSLWFRAGNTARLPFRRRGVGLIYRGPCFLNPNSCSGDPSFNRVRHNTVMMLRSLNAADAALSWAALILVVIAALPSYSLFAMEQQVKCLPLLVAR